MRQDPAEEEGDEGLEVGDDLFNQVVLPGEGKGQFRRAGQASDMKGEERDAYLAGWGLEPDAEAEEQLDDEVQEESSDEEMMDDKSEGEMEAIQYEMHKLIESVPALHGSYKLVDRLGEGE